MMVVHGEQDMHFHQPLVPGRSLTTTAEVYAFEAHSNGDLVIANGRAEIDG
jgi:acyl dehydratase